MARVHLNRLTKSTQRFNSLRKPVAMLHHFQMPITESSAEQQHADTFCKPQLSIRDIIIIKTMNDCVNVNRSRMCGDVGVGPFNQIASLKKRIRTTFTPDSLVELFNET